VYWLADESGPISGQVVDLEQHPSSDEIRQKILLQFLIRSLNHKIFIMPKLAVFPKAYMQALCKDGTMKLSEWIELAVKLDIDGLEWYADLLKCRIKTIG
jgi:hypothetical protein